jgi:hypothetical protein
MSERDATDQRIAIVTPSLARDFSLCRELNESVLRFLPPTTRHYIIVDACDLKVFAPLAGSRTIIGAVEDVLPKGYVKLRFSKKWWFSLPALFPLKGWLVQQLVKMSSPGFATERVLVNVDSDVRFIREVDPEIFVRGGRTRMYRLPGGVTADMHHAIWHRNICKLLGVAPDAPPMNDYVGNVISWDRNIVLAARKRIEDVTGLPWHVACTRAQRVGEYMIYGLFVDKVLGQATAPVWIDERSWCHTYWGPEPLPEANVTDFAHAMREDDVAFSIAGYTSTPPDVLHAVTQLAVRVASGGDAAAATG